MFIVIDNFLDEPHKFICEAKKNRNIDIQIKTASNYPGKKVSTSIETKLFIENKVNQLLNYKYQCGELQYQFIDGSFIKGIPHEDSANNYKYTSILFLNQQSPNNTGLEIYQRWDNYFQDSFINPINLHNTVTEKEHFFNSTNKTILSKIKYTMLVEKFKYNLEKRGKRISIPNKFNRCVIFDSNLVHCAQNYFGTDETNCRLNLVGFFR